MMIRSSQKLLKYSIEEGPGILRRRIGISQIPRKNIGSITRTLHSSTAQQQNPSISTHNPTSNQIPPIQHNHSRSETTPQSTSSSKQADVIKSAPFPIFTTVCDFRKWRLEKMKEGKSVGFVPTMGALHDGHLSLVKESFKQNDETVVSIFVNPAQFAPTEDLSSYPRTLPNDILALNSISQTQNISAIFAPTVSEMYPSPDGRPFTQVVSEQVGAFVEVAGLQHKMEGASRPTFFRGVATIVTKLFHVVQPDKAYFGQKDIQQSIILKRLVSDLLFTFPPNSNSVCVLPTKRDPIDGLALSSRNTYLTQKSRKYANVLFESLSVGENVWNSEPGNIQKVLKASREKAFEISEKAEKENIYLDILYIDLNDPITLDNLENRKGKSILSNDYVKKNGAILSAAALIKDGINGKETRLIDNFLLGFKL